MLIKLIHKAEKAVNKSMASASKKKKKETLATLHDFMLIGKLILDEEIANADLREVIYESISKELLASKVEQTDNWLESKYNHEFLLLKDRYSYFRQFFPVFLNAIDLINDGLGSENHVLEAINALKTLNLNHDSSCPVDIPVEFIQPQLKQFIINDDGSIDRQGWELALLKTVRDEIKEGNLSASKGSFFQEFSQFFMPSKRWQQEREQFFLAAKLPISSKGIRAYLIDRLHRSIDKFVKLESENDYAKVENDRWVLSVDKANELSEEDSQALAKLKSFLKDNMREIKLPDLLIEVDNDLHITNYFMSYEKRRTRDKEAIVDVIATWMAFGCGIGMSTMVSLVPGITYDRLRGVSDYYVSEEDNARYALADVVNALCDLDITGNWGIGQASASDSIRMEYHNKVLHREYSTCFGDYAIEFYTFVADNYAPFFSKPIECTNRDAVHVLDGILYNETSLQLLDHYVDTHGYMEINFTGFTMFGKRLNPRIKGIKKQWLYMIDPTYHFGSLAPLLKGKAHQVDMDCIVDQYDRMGQLLVRHPFCKFH